MEFVPGRLYNRRKLHAQYGGQRQGGISTPKDQPAILLFTGESGKAYGYHDGFQPDGTFWYTGEGQIGDMAMLRGNLAIRDSGVNGKTLHLFQTDQKGWVQYLGEASYAGHHFAPAPDRNGNPRRAIVFELVTASHGSGEPAIREVVDEVADDRLWRKSLKELRDLATRTQHNLTPKERKSNAYQRSQAVKVYVLKRASGVCESCGKAAPFKTPRGRGYLEPHHLRRVADQGPDHPRWVAALCPNCHREVHYGEHGPKLNEQLAAKLEKVERP